MGTSTLAFPMTPPSEGEIRLGIFDNEPEVCRVFHGKGNTTLGVLKNISIAPDGSITMKCSSDGKFTARPEERAVIYTHESAVGNTSKVGRPILCRTISSIILVDGEPEYTYAYTDDWQNVVSKSGMSSLICHYRGGGLGLPAGEVE